MVAIELLEGAAIELAGRHVAGHSRERDRIEKGVGQADRQVGRTGTAGGECRGRLPRHTVVDVGHEAGDTLMTTRDRGDLLGAFVERIDQADVAMAAEPEGVGTFSRIRWSTIT
jgi:hypothetical protein